MFAVLNPVFEETFIPHSFSCRVGKGTHRGVATLESMARAVSGNYTRPCFALKCDVQEFFASVDNQILLGLISSRIRDRDTMWLLMEIIESFPSLGPLFSGKGLPIGNLASQLFASIYLNELDQFVKHQLGIKHYVRSKIAYSLPDVLVANGGLFLFNNSPPLTS